MRKLLNIFLATELRAILMYGKSAALIKHTSLGKSNKYHTHLRGLELGKITM